MMWQSEGYTYPAIQSEIGPDERVLWSGRPAAGIRFRAADVFAIPFTVVWLGAVVLAASGEIRAGRDPAGLAALSVFLLVGLYFVFGRFLMDAWVRRHTWYAVTNQRILIVTDAFGRKVRALNLRALPELSLRERKDHSGDILLGQPGPYEMWAGLQWPGMTAGLAARFEMIPDVRHVFDITQEAQRAAT